MYKVRDLTFPSPKNVNKGMRRADSTRCRERAEWDAEGRGPAPGDDDDDDDSHPLGSSTAVEVWRAFSGDDLFGPTDLPAEEVTSTGSSSDFVLTQQPPMRRQIPQADASREGQEATGDPAAHDWMTNTAVGLRAIENQHATLEEAVAQLEMQWKDRQQRQQAQLDTLRNKERLMAEELTELKCRYREDFARLSRQKEEALESQQRLLRLAADQDRKVQRQAERLEEQEALLRRQARRLEEQEQELALQGEHLSHQTGVMQLHGQTAAQAWRSLQLAMEEKCAEWHSAETLRQRQRAEYHAELLQAQGRELAEWRRRCTAAEGASREATAHKEDLAQQVCRLSAQLASHREASALLQDGLRGQLELLQSHNDRLQKLALEKQSLADRLQAGMAVSQREPPPGRIADSNLFPSPTRHATPLDRAAMVASPVGSVHSLGDGGDVLLRQLDAAQRYTDDLRQRLEAAEDRLRQLQEEKEQLAAEVAQLSTSNETAEKQAAQQRRALLADQQAQLAGEVAARTAAERDLAVAEQALRALQEQHGRCAAERTAAEDAAAALQASLAAAEAALESRAREAQRLRLLQQCDARRRLREAHATAGSHGLGCSRDGFSSPGSLSVSPLAEDWASL
eukprot:EG_transcript_4880